MKMELEKKFYFFKGRVALYAILKAMDIKQGDEIILPGFTCVVVPCAIKYLGAKPVYVDINKDNYNINTGLIENKITKNTRAIVAQHTFGIPANMDEIIKLAKKYKLFVIEDSAHAWGSKYKGNYTGAMGDASFFSTQWSKPFTTGLGGFTIVNNSDLLSRMKEIYNYFEKPRLKDEVLLTAEYFIYKLLFNPKNFWFLMNLYRKLYNSNIIPGSSDRCELDIEKPERYQLKMAPMQKKIFDRQFKSIDIMINHRKIIAGYYDNYFKSRGVISYNIPKYCETVLLRYPVLVNDKVKVLEIARKKRMEIGDWFVSPLHPLINDLKKAGYENGSCPVAEDISKRIINLPTHQYINERIAGKICDFILSVR